MIRAISDNEHAVVHGVKLFIVIHYGGVAIGCINNSTRVRVDILVIGSDREDHWLFLKVGFLITVCVFYAFDFNVDGLGG